MHLKIIVGAIVAGWLIFKKWWNKIYPIIAPLVQDAEQRALDGKIGLDDRKAIVMGFIDILEKNGTIKLNVFEKLLIGKVVDYIAEHLPDFTVSKGIQDVIKILPQ